MGLRSTDCVTFTINIPQSPLFLCSIERRNLNKMTQVRPASGCVHGGASCRQRSSAPVLERSAGSLSKQVGWERACAYLLSSFTCSAFLFLRGDHGNANRSRDAVYLEPLSAEEWFLGVTTLITPCDVFFLFLGGFSKIRFSQSSLLNNLIKAFGKWNILFLKFQNCKI